MGRALWCEIGGNRCSHPGRWADDPTGDSGCGGLSSRIRWHLDRQGQVRVWSLQPWVQFPSGQGGGRDDVCMCVYTCTCASVCVCVSVRVCAGCLAAPSCSDPALPARSRPQPRLTFESYGVTSSPSHVWLSPPTTQPSFPLPRTAPLLSVSGCLGGGAAPRAHRGGLVWKEGVIRANRDRWGSFFGRLVCS